MHLLLRRPEEPALGPPPLGHILPQAIELELLVPPESEEVPDGDNGRHHQEGTDQDPDRHPPDQAPGAIPGAVRAAVIFPIPGPHS